MGRASQAHGRRPLRRGHMAKARACAALLFLWLPGASHAADQGAARLLTWEDCVSLALSQNPDLASSRYAEQAGAANYKGSFNGLLPSLTLSNTYSKSNLTARTYGAQAKASVDILNASSI